MKNAPYKEIIDLATERKEYFLLCKCKSKKYTLYSQWEDHIKAQLARFRSATDMNNFKRYCINISRGQAEMPNMFTTCIGWVVAIYIGKMCANSPDYTILALLLMMFICLIICGMKLKRQKCFYDDIINIIDSLEAEKGFLSSQSTVTADKHGG